MNNKISQFWNKTKKTSKKVYKDFWNHDKHPKKIDRWTSRLNSILVILIVGMIVFGLFWQLGGIVREAIEDFIEERLISKLIDAQELVFENASSDIGSRIDPGSGVDSNGKLISSSFTDLFSGVGWINQDDTTFYHDQTTTALSFPPNFDWSRVEEGEVDPGRFVEKRDDGSDRRCIESQCLVQKDSNLYFGDQSIEDLENSDYQINIPNEINLDNLVNVSIGKLDTRWTVGFVEEVNGKFLGKAYYFDGKSFQLISDKDLFESDYEGKIGFGGNDNDFLIIYGAYQGKGYRIVNGEKSEDISNFLGIRLMNEGFHPQIIKGDEGDWYIFSLTPGNSKLIKLFENGSDTIKGVVDLTELLSISRLESASFYVSDEDRDTLLAKVDSSEDDFNYWKFVDKGFDKSSSQVIFSSNINNNPSEVKEATIVDTHFSDVGGDVKFYLSNNKRDWFEVDINETIEFPDQSGKQLLWKAEIEPNDNEETTPFLDLIRLNYKLHFL